MEQCTFCGSKNRHAFFKQKKQWACRMCLSYVSQIQTQVQSHYLDIEDSEYRLPFSLSKSQIEASKQILHESRNHDVLVEAVCGAGKTELVLEAIEEALKNNKKVVWAIPRRQVVLQLANRLNNLFKNIEVIAVCQGFTSKVQAPLIVCTTHQLFRYNQCVDLLILDEPDAFPYKDNVMLQKFVENAVIGHIIYLTATPSKEHRKAVKDNKLKHVTLYTRPFNNPLVLPEVTMHLKKTLPWVLHKLLKKQLHKTLIFVPTIKTANKYSKLFKIPAITSKTENKEELIQQFLENKFSFLLCTTILERGVTFSNVHVIVVEANHIVFDTASLIQISGRVGRDKEYPSGNCFFLISEKSKEVSQCISLISQANHSVYGV